MSKLIGLFGFLVKKQINAEAFMLTRMLNNVGLGNLSIKALPLRLFYRAVRLQPI